jgi:hypothetical protein
VGEHIKRFLVPSWQGDLYGHAHQEPIGTIWVFLTADAFPWLIIALVVLNVLLFRKTFKISNWQLDAKTKYCWCWFLGQMLFFTFAKNIIPTYTLTALPALAFLIVKLLQPMVIQENKIKPWFYACGMITPVLVLGMVLLQPIRPELTQSSARELSEVYPHDHTFAEKPMLYVGKRYFSMEFYRHGKVARFSSLEAAIDYGKKNNIDILAIANARLPGMNPETLKSIQLIQTIPKFGIYKIPQVNNKGIQ